ncbi:MAG: hypothetical protein KC486_05190, partial [Myxococcales bacterium]|nr:hypothetical protein [Myxococcales bacterium]
SFDENHQPYFFGREREIAALRDWAEEAAAGARGLHFIVGGSGSGKLSLLRAGLIPALRGRRERRWRVAVIRPADDRERPQSALSAAFVRAMGDALAVDSRAGVDALLATLRGASEQGESLLLIVSRFEEVFTHLPSRAQATAYVRALAELAACPGVAVAATLRTDFIPRCAELRLADGRRLDELLYDDRERMLLGAPGAAALRDLIVGPARAVGIRLEPALVERLVADIEGEAAALPLLQHCLDLLWTERRGRLLTLDSYERLGRIAGALARSADAVLAGLGPAEREQARCLLVALIDLGEDLAPRGRRRLDRELLRPLVDSAQADFDRVVDALSEGRLLVTGATMADDGRRSRSRRGRAPTVWLDLAHEALIDRWPTLRAWLDEDRVDLLALRRVVSAYQEWRAHLSERRARYDYLLVGDRLHEALRLTRRRPGLVPGPVLVFIYESEELVAASRMRGLVERLLPTYAAPLALAFLPGLAALERAPQIELATIPALLAGAVVFAATLRAWGWAVLVQERVLNPAPVDSAIHAWILSALAGLAAWGAAGVPDLTDIFWLIPWSGWISLALAALALGRALLVTRVIHHEPAARRWGRGQLVVAVACVALNLGALATAHPWALWLAALAVDVAGAALLRPRLDPRGDDDGRTTAGKIDDAAVIAAVIVILGGLPAAAVDGLALLSLAAMIGPSLGLLSALALESRRPYTRDDHARGDLPQVTPIDARWLLTRAPLLVGISLAGAAGQRLVAADGDVGRGAWSLALFLFFLGVLLDRSAARGQADRGRRIAYVAASIAAVAPALTLAFRGLPAPPWALSIAALAVVGLWVTRRELLPRWVKRRILNAEAAARVPRTGPDSAALVETLTHTGSGLLLRDDPEYKAVVGRPW